MRVAKVKDKIEVKDEIEIEVKDEADADAGKYLSSEKPCRITKDGPRGLSKRSTQFFHTLFNRRSLSQYFMSTLEHA